MAFQLDILNEHSLFYGNILATVAIRVIFMYLNQIQVNAAIHVLFYDSKITKPVFVEVHCKYLKPQKAQYISRKIKCKLC